MENKQTPEKSVGSEMNKPVTATMPGQAGNQPGSGQSTGSSATQQARHQEAGQKPAQQTEEQWNEMKDRGAEVVDKAKQTVTDAYKRTSETLNEGYEQAKDYGRENPGQTALVMFGVGIGVGIWLANGMSSRSRASRIVPPVMNALSDIAMQLFR